ncbi:MAG: AraC family transcriptional regulator [Gammaproteobacteria bacterium]|nr:AraC family transcriptional regulator [Gammaproteobacteria bacterium]
MSTIFSEQLFAKHEKEFRPFLAEVGLPEYILDRPDVEIPVDKYLELLEIVARKANPSIGLIMGQSIEPADLGVYGHAMAASHNVRHMLEVMSRYLYVFAQANSIRVDVGKNRVVVSYQFRVPKKTMYQQDVEFAVSTIITLLRNLTGRMIQPFSVDFEHRKPVYSKLHNQIFDCEVRFARPGNRIHLNKTCLDLPILGADHRLFEALEFSLADRLKVRSDEDDLITKVNHLISVTLGESGPDIKYVARMLGMSHRTLQRRLTTQNLVFNDMVDSIRKAIAIDYVQHSDYSLTDIALMVGYCELSSFSRAFKRWTGKSPQHLRGS